MAFYPCKPSESKAPTSQTGAFYRCWIGSGGGDVSYLIQFCVDQTATTLTIVRG